MENCQQRGNKTVCQVRGSLRQLLQQLSSGMNRGNNQPGSCKQLCAPFCVPGSGRTLRETVLESSPILALLNESFISSWSLVKELEELQVSVTAPLLSLCLVLVNAGGAWHRGAGRRGEITPVQMRDFGSKPCVF